MTFYRADPALAAEAAALKAGIERDFDVPANDWAFTLVVHARRLTARAGATEPAAFWADAPRGTAHRGDVPFYPASVAKLFWLVALEAWLEQSKLEENPAIARARRDMIEWSSNEATNYLIDLITGTTSGPELPDLPFSAWTRARYLAQIYLKSWQWPELVTLNLCQKFYDDCRYGREYEFVGHDGFNHNRLTTDAAARLMVAIMGGIAVTPARANTMAALCRRPIDAASRAAEPGNQVDGFLGEGLPEGSKLWSKAGLTLWTHHEPSAWRRHDAAYVELPCGKAFTLVVFTQGRARAENTRLLPEIGRLVATRVEAGI
jgi:beta-lactamase class A